MKLLACVFRSAALKSPAYLKGGTPLAVRTCASSSLDISSKHVCESAVQGGLLEALSTSSICTCSMRHAEMVRGRTLAAYH